MHWSWLTDVSKLSKGQSYFLCYPPSFPLPPSESWIGLMGISPLTGGNINWISAAWPQAVNNTYNRARMSLVQWLQCFTWKEEKVWQMARANHLGGRQLSGTLLHEIIIPLSFYGLKFHWDEQKRGSVTLLWRGTIKHLGREELRVGRGVGWLDVIVSEDLADR